MLDKPSRAKTPYNYFYQEMFQEIVIHQDEDDNNNNNNHDNNNNNSNNSNDDNDDNDDNDMDHFHLENQETIMTCSPVSVFHVIANQWKRLSTQERQYYHDLAAADKQRYMQEMAEWHHHHHHHPCRHNHVLAKSPRR